MKENIRASCNDLSAESGRADESTPIETEPEKGSKQSRRSRFWLMAVILLAILLGWPIWSGFYTDWLWFQQLGYQTVFSTTLVTKVALGLTVGLIAASFIALNFRLALRQSPEPKLSRSFFEVEGRNVPVPDFTRLVRPLALPVALAAGVFLGARAWGLWDVVLRYRYQIPFGETDPTFGRDIAYYVFTLPALLKAELARMAEQGGCQVEVVNYSDALMQLGGVGALLRYLSPEQYACAGHGQVGKSVG